MGACERRQALFIADLSHCQRAELHFKASGQMSQQFAVAVFADTAAVRLTQCSQSVSTWVGKQEGEGGV